MDNKKELLTENQIFIIQLVGLSILGLKYTYRQFEYFEINLLFIGHYIALLAGISLYIFKKKIITQIFVGFLCVGAFAVPFGWLGVVSRSNATTSQMFHMAIFLSYATVAIRLLSMFPEKRR